MSDLRTFAVSLTIPDNEAFTAAQALRRLEIPVATLARATVYRIGVGSTAAETIETTLRSLEAVFNPNKHRLVERSEHQPRRSEVWIAARDADAARTIGGRTLADVHSVERYTAWELLDDRGMAVDPSLVDRAVEMFLCNPAFQKAIRCPT